MGESLRSSLRQEASAKSLIARQRRSFVSLADPVAPSLPMSQHLFGLWLSNIPKTFYTSFFGREICKYWVISYLDVPKFI